MNKFFALIIISIICIGCVQKNDIISSDIPKESINNSADPSACYCAFLGYNIIIEKGPGGEHGIIILPNGDTADTWQFYRGQIDPQYNYCAEKGYKTEVDTVNHGTFTTVSCGCVKYDSNHDIIEKISVMELMRIYGDTLCQPMKK